MALVQVLTKRLTLFYNGQTQLDEEKRLRMEEQFGNVVMKILQKMRKIENELRHVCGNEEKQKKVLAPILKTLKPIMDMLGLSQFDLVHNSNNFQFKMLPGISEEEEMRKT